MLIKKLVIEKIVNSLWVFIDKIHVEREREREREGERERERERGRERELIPAINLIL